MRQRREAAELAERQHGVVATRQLEALGWGRPAIARHAADGRLRAVFRGVFAWGHAVLRLEGRWMAAVLACGDGATLSHADGLMLHDVIRSSSPRIHVTVPRLTGGAHRREGIVIHRCKLDPQDRVVVNGIPTTTLARALLDYGETAPARRLDRALDESEKRGLLDLDAVLDALDRGKGRRGIKPLRRAIDLYVPEPHRLNSWLERHALPLIRDAGLPMPQVNLHLHGHEVDLQWPQQRLVVELDSRAHHHTSLAFEQDRARDADHVANGYRVMRFTHRRVTREPQAVTALIGQALSAAGAAR